MRHAVRHLKKSDPVLAAIIERVGPYRLTFREPTFGRTRKSASPDRERSMRFAANLFAWVALLAVAAWCSPDSKCQTNDVTAPIDRDAEVSLQRFVNEGHQPWRMDSEPVAAEELIRLEYPETRTSVYQVNLRQATESRTRAVYTWSRFDGSRRYRIEVRRPNGCCLQPRSMNGRFGSPYGVSAPTAKSTD